jgi:hypothetical protein
MTQKQKTRLVPTAVVLAFLFLIPVIFIPVIRSGLNKDRTIWVTVDWEPNRRHGQGSGVSILLNITGNPPKAEYLYNSAYVRSFTLKPGTVVDVVAKQETGTYLRCLISQVGGMENKVDIPGKGTVPCRLTVV